MIKLPNKVKIGGHEYCIKFPYNFKERADLQGQADHALLEIRVMAVDECGVEKPDSTIIVTVLHELIHCIDNCSGMKKLNGGSEEKEQIVEMLAQGLLQVFSDNIQLVEGLFGERYSGQDSIKVNK